MQQLDLGFIHGELIRLMESRRRGLEGILDDL